MKTKKGGQKLLFKSSHSISLTWIAIHFVTALSITYGQVGVSPNPVPPVFEVASVRLVQSGQIIVPPGQIVFGPRARSVTLVGNRVTAETSLEELILFAYEVRYHEIAGPDWLSNRRYQLTALVPEGTTRSALPPMLRQLLTERLGLKVHWEDRVQSVRALLIAETGHKLTEVQEPENAPKRNVTVAGTAMKVAMFTGPGHFFSTGMTLDLLATMLGNEFGEPVINRTGLEKAYSIDSRWTPHAREGAVLRLAGSDSEYPRAMLKQLGLRLEKQRLPRKILVVDHADLKPIEN